MGEFRPKRLSGTYPCPKASEATFWTGQKEVSVNDRDRFRAPFRRRNRANEIANGTGKPVDASHHQLVSGREKRDDARQFGLALPPTAPRSCSNMAPERSGSAGRRGGRVK